MIRLYVEEVRALPRGRFAWAGLTLLLLALVLLATLTGAVEAGLYGYGLLVYVAGPSALAAFAAAQVSGARSSRFTEPLFTSPVTKLDFFAAKILVSLTVGLLYLALTLPFLAVYAYHTTVPAILIRFLLAGAGLVVVATALGTFFGVLFTGRSIAAPVSVALGIMLLGSFAVSFLQLISEQVLRGEWTPLVRLVHISPQSHLLGLTSLLGSLAPVSPLRSLAALAVFSIGLLLLAGWTFLRLQGVETWETGPGSRVLLVLLAAGVALAPAVVADTAYEPVRAAPTGYGSASLGLDATLVPAGTPLRDIRFGHVSSDPATIPAGKATAMDLVVRFHADAGAPLRNLTLALTPRDDRLIIEGDTRVTLPQLVDYEVDDRPRQPRPVLRIPVTVTPIDPKALGPSIYNANVTVTYFTGQEDALNEAYADFLLFAEIPGGTAHLALAGVPLPALCAAAAVLRRTRKG